MTRRCPRLDRYVLRYLAVVLLCAAAATAVGWLFRRLQFPETNIVVVYILFVVLTARYTNGYVYGIAATAAATCAFNYFFTEPYFTLKVNDPTYIITLIIMALTSVITSTLTSKAKQSALEAKKKEAEASALYRLTSRLTDASDLSSIVETAVRTISAVMECRAACVCFDENGAPEPFFIQQRGPEDQAHRSVEDGSGMRHRMENLQTEYFAGPEFYDWPIPGRDSILGVLRIPSENAERLDDAQMRLLRSMIESTALAMDRLRSAEAQMRSREEIVQERYRGNLLRAISHDLRTPLSGIMGTSEILMGMTDREDERYSMAEGIYKDAEGLHSLVENILSLTRLQDGRLVLERQMEAVEEVIGAAVMTIGKRVPGREISVHIPENPLFVPMEAKLIGQVLVNLLDNAVRHTPPDGEILIDVSEDVERRLAVFRVKDRGGGIAAADLPRLFQMFYTTHGKSTDAQRGIGLGLAICESIVKAHGGSIKAENRDGGGAEFLFTLPLEVKKDDGK